MRTLAQTKQPTQEAQSTNSKRPVRTLAGPRHDLSASAPFAHDFSRIPVHANARTNIHPKLKINAPGDKYEQEADSVADQVMRMANPVTPAHAPAVAPELSGSRLQRLGSRPMPTAVPAWQAPPSVHDAIRSPGRRIAPVDRSWLEPRLDRDLGNVRIHTGPVAERAARDVQAQAFTYGRDIVLGRGSYQPGTFRGRRLLVHELTHVMQQSVIPTGTLQRQCGSVADCHPNEEDYPTIKRTGGRSPVFSCRPAVGKAQQKLNQFFTRVNYSFCRSLQGDRKNDRGADGRRRQDLINAAKNEPQLTVDCYFGTKTRIKARGFQAAIFQDPREWDGIIDREKTWRQLVRNEIDTCPFVISAITQAPEGCDPAPEGLPTIKRTGGSQSSRYSVRPAVGFAQDILNQFLGAFQSLAAVSRSCSAASPRRLDDAGSDRQPRRRLIEASQRVSPGARDPDELRVDCWFGTRTEMKTKGFQASVFEDPREWDGMIGSKTWRALLAFLSQRTCPYVSTQESQSPVTPRRGVCGAEGTCSPDPETLPTIRHTGGRQSPSSSCRPAVGYAQNILRRFFRRIRNISASCTAVDSGTLSDRRSTGRTRGELIRDVPAVIPVHCWFDLETKRATLAFQAAVFQDPAKWDGVIGEKTWDALHSFLLHGICPFTSATQSTCPCTTPLSSREWVERQWKFPRLNRSHTCKLGGRDSAYNCMGWTLMGQAIPRWTHSELRQRNNVSEWVPNPGQSDRVVFNDKLSEFRIADYNQDGAVSTDDLDRFYGILGITGVLYYGSTPGHLVHVAKREGGTGRACTATSKIGGNILIAHDRYELEGGIYGSLQGGR